MATSLVRRSLSNRYLVNTAMTVVYGPQFRPRYRFEQVINRGNTNDCFRGKERCNCNSSHYQNVGNIAIGVALGVGALCIWSIKENIKELQAYCHGDAKSSTADSDKPRTGYLDWDNYFMGVAFLSAKRSKDPKTQVGACIINDNDRIVGVGYNGMPNGCKDSELPWGKGAGIEDSKTFYVCHAELNAVLNSNSATLEGCKIYVSLFPCNECAKVIIQSGIKEVIYYSDKNWDKPETKASKKMFKLAKVNYSQFDPKEKQIMIDFSSINRDVKPDN